MRVIFVDFDGVLHEARGDIPESQHFEWLPILVELIAPHVDVGVAVHSSWRHMHTDDELRQFMRPLAERYIGPVPPGDRERSIRAFLKQMPQVRDYLVIDDTASEFSRIRGRRLVICDSQTGLSDSDAQLRVTDWLNGSLLPVSGRRT